MLELRGVRKAYGSVVALDAIDLTVRRGEVFGFVGPNGAGKSTAMRIALGVLAADAGEVRVDGRPVDEQLRRRIGYMPEERGLYPKMRARRQLAYFAQLHGMDRRSADEAALRWLSRLGLADRADDPVEKLSLGNQQRVQLGAALVHDPQLLVLDEPFSGLDPVGVDVMAEVLRERVAGGVACLFSSHQLELVEQLCHSVGIIRSGRVVAAGPVRALRRDRAGHRLRVEVDGAPPGWARTLRGVAVTEQTGTAVLLDLADGADEQAVLDAARAAGRVTHFSRVEPTLAELFRSVVAA